MDLQNHWEGVKKEWRHIVNTMDNDKVNKTINNFNKHYISHVNTEDVEYSVDWGCGGGLLSKQLKKFSKVISIDISTDSLENCKKYARPYKAILIKEPEDVIIEEKVDLVFANAIVWHFPSLEYFERVLDIWYGLSPKYIVFNTKRSDEVEEVKNYNREYLSALKLSDKWVEEKMKQNGYEVVKKSLPGNTAVKSTHYVFKKI